LRRHVSFHQLHDFRTEAETAEVPRPEHFMIGDTQALHLLGVGAGAEVSDVVQESGDDLFSGSTGRAREVSALQGVLHLRNAFAKVIALSGPRIQVEQSCHRSRRRALDHVVAPVSLSSRQLPPFRKGDILSYEGSGSPADPRIALPWWRGR